MDFGKSKTVKRTTVKKDKLTQEERDSIYKGNDVRDIAASAGATLDLMRLKKLSHAAGKEHLNILNIVRKIISDTYLDTANELNLKLLLELKDKEEVKDKPDLGFVSSARFLEKRSRKSTTIDS